MVLLNSCSLILETYNSTSKDVKKRHYILVLLLIIYWLVQKCHMAAPIVIEMWQKHTGSFLWLTRNLSGVYKIKWISPWDNEKTVRQKDMSNVKIEVWDLTCGLFTLHSQSQCCHLPYVIKKMRFASNTTDTTRSYLKKYTTNTE